MHCESGETDTSGDELKSFAEECGKMNEMTNLLRWLYGFEPIADTK